MAYEVRVVSGESKSEVWNQIKADILNSRYCTINREDISILSLEERKLVDKERIEPNESITYEEIDENEVVWEIKYYFSEYNKLNKIVERTNNPSLYLVFIHDMKNEFGEPIKEWTIHNRDEKVAHFYVMFNATDRRIQTTPQLSIYPDDSSFYMYFEPIQEN